MKISLLGGFALLAVWIVTAFLIRWPSGWAHLPLIAAVVLIARGIALSDPRDKSSNEAE